MKAQAATIEAIIASTMLFSAMSVYAYVAYSISSMKNYINSYNMIYSFVSATYYNSSFSKCLDLYNQTCILYFLADLKVTYGLSHITLNINNESLNTGNTTSVCHQKQAYCLLLGGAAARIACIYTCGA